MIRLTGLQRDAWKFMRREMHGSLCVHLQVCERVQTWTRDIHGSWNLDRLMDLKNLHGSADFLTSHLSVFTGLVRRSSDGVHKKNAQGGGGAPGNDGATESTTLTTRNSTTRTQA